MFVKVKCCICGNHLKRDKDCQAFCDNNSCETFEDKSSYGFLYMKKGGLNDG